MTVTFRQLMSITFHFSTESLESFESTQEEDSGLYECQISTSPVMSHYVYLAVSNPTTSILGAPHIYFAEGTTMNLTCVVSDSPDPPKLISWKHDTTIISYSSPRGGISQITEKGDTTASFLLVQGAKTSDSGLYSCQPSIGNTASVQVTIVRGSYFCSTCQKVRTVF